MPLIVSIARRVQGLESMLHFAVIEGSVFGGYKCLGCGTHVWDRVSPVELADGGEIDPDETGDCSPLCRICSYSTSKRIGSAWPSGLKVDDVSAVWKMVNAEQARDVERELERDRATALEETQRANAALKQARADQGVDCAAEVA